MSRRWGRRAGVAVLLAVTACSGGDGGNDDGSRESARPLPVPVDVRQEPDNVALADPTFDPLPGARAEFQRAVLAILRDWGPVILIMWLFQSLETYTGVVRQTSIDEYLYRAKRAGRDQVVGEKVPTGEGSGA